MRVKTRDLEPAALRLYNRKGSPIISNFGRYQKRKFENWGHLCRSVVFTSNVLIYKDERGVDLYITRYQGIIISLLYLTVSVSDIMFSMCMCASIKHQLRILTFKLILRYLNGTSNHDLWYPKGRGCILVG